MYDNEMLEWFLLSAKLVSVLPLFVLHAINTLNTHAQAKSPQSLHIWKRRLVQKKKVWKMGGKWERERRSRRRAVQRFLWECVSHLSDRLLVSILATLSDRHCQMIISQALHLAHTQMEAVYVCEPDKRKMWYCLVSFLSVFLPQHKFECSRGISLSAWQARSSVFT